MIEARLLMPGVNFIGRTVRHDMEIYSLSGGSLIPRSDNLHTSGIIRCAVDPNDKLVIPEGIANEHYTLFGDTLLYRWLQ
jgi:hypothetical protein